MQTTQLRSPLLRTQKHLKAAASAFALCLLLAACGGNDAADAQSTQGDQTATVVGADGASVQVQKIQRADNEQVTVRVARDGTGAPALPEGHTPRGAVYQFTPLGWVEEAIEIRVPFSASAAADKLRLLVAQPGGNWVEIVDAQVDGQFMVARVQQLAFATVTTSPDTSDASDAEGHKRALTARSTGHSSTRPIVLSFDASATQPALPKPDKHGTLTVKSDTSLSLTLQYALPKCSVAPVIEVQALVWSPTTKRTKTVHLGKRVLTSTSGSFSLTQSLSSSDNGTWFIKAVAHCNEPRLPCPRYSLQSSAPTLVVHIDPKAPVVLPVIASNPQDQSVVDGAQASFSVTAQGTGLAYQWQRSNDGGTTYTAVTGATTASYKLTASLADNDALFRVRVSNANGSVTSTSAKLTVSAKVVAPLVTTNPANQSVIEGESASFNVVGTGQPAPTVQWQRRDAANANPEAGWADIAGASQSTYTVVGTTLSQNGNQYRAVLRNAGGTRASGAATLTVNPRGVGIGVAPFIISTHQSVWVPAGQYGAMAITAGGTSPMSYQWFKDGQPIVGANAPNVMVLAEPGDAGRSYQITVTVTNSAGLVVSGSVAFYVIAP